MRTRKTRLVKKIAFTIAFAIFLCSLACLALADEGQWLTSLPPALEIAKSQNKMVLLDFTGSDWCGWCKKLDAETFSQPAFLDYAAKNVVLVRVDFPKKTPHSDDEKQANKALAEKYKVSGYPTIVVLKSDGDMLFKNVGYMAGGPAAMVSKLNELNPNAAKPAAAATPSALPPGFASGPPAPAPTPDGEPHLQGIFYSATHASVLLNGQSCKEGDTVDGIHVLKIAPDKVTVEWHGQTKELRML
jgi:thioredoxin-related protein